MDENTTHDDFSDFSALNNLSTRGGLNSPNAFAHSTQLPKQTASNERAVLDAEIDHHLLIIGFGHRLGGQEFSKLAAKLQVPLSRIQSRQSFVRRQQNKLLEELNITEYVFDQRAKKKGKASADPPFEDPLLSSTPVTEATAESVLTDLAKLQLNRSDPEELDVLVAWDLAAAPCTAPQSESLLDAAGQDSHNDRLIYNGNRRYRQSKARALQNIVEHKAGQEPERRKKKAARGAHIKPTVTRVNKDARHAKREKRLRKKMETTADAETKQRLWNIVQRLQMKGFEEMSKDAKKLCEGEENQNMEQADDIVE